MAVHYTDTLDRTFHALGDASRRRMLAAIAERRECTAGELGALCESAQPTVSRHLRVLQAAGLVARRKDGRHQRFTLAPTPMRQAQGWLERHLAFWEGSLDQLESLLEELKSVEGKGSTK
ncbi:MAG: metalloregulator ArsR/SmtB family transcription factor [Bauldia sp.]